VPLSRYSYKNARL